MGSQIMLLDYAVAADGVKARVLVTGRDGSAVQLSTHVHPSEELTASLRLSEDAIKRAIKDRMRDLIGER